MYTLKNKKENKDVCISVNGLNLKHNSIVHGKKEEIEAQLNKDWSLEASASEEVKKEVKKKND